MREMEERGMGKKEIEVKGIETRGMEVIARIHSDFDEKFGIPARAASWRS